MVVLALASPPPRSRRRRPSGPAPCSPSSSRRRAPARRPTTRGSWPRWCEPRSPPATPRSPSGSPTGSSPATRSTSTPSAPPAPSSPSTPATTPTRQPSTPKRPHAGRSSGTFPSAPMPSSARAAACSPSEARSRGAASRGPRPLRVDGLQAGARRDRGAARADGECAEFLGELILLQALNTAARLTDRAGAGEILISADAAMAAGLETTGLERRTLELRGRAQALDPGSPEPPLTLDDDLAGDRQRTLQ